MLERLHISDIVFGVALSFMLGIAVASFGWSVGLACAVAMVIGSVILFFVKRVHFWKILLMFIAAIFFGAFYYHFYFNLRDTREHIIFNKKISFSGVIVDEPQVREKYQSLAIDLSPPVSGNIRVLVSPQDVFHYGDAIQADGAIESRIVPADTPTVAFPKVRILSEHNGFWLKEKLIDFKSGLVEQFTRALPGDESALLAGITLGVQSGFTNEFKSQMAASGTTHLVALSGYNIAILVFAVAQVFGMFLSRRKTFYLTSLVIALFVLMVGTQASVIRAAIMGFLGLLAREAGRLYSMRNAVTLTALGMALLNPGVLVFDVGFELSFLSLLGIVYLAPAIQEFLKIKKGRISGLGETALLTLSAQLAVMPVIITVFGQFSLLAVIANVLILEFVPFTMFLGFVLAALGSLNFSLGFVSAKLVQVLLTYEVAVIKLFAAVRLPVPISFVGSIVAMAVYYAIGIFFIYEFSPRVSQKKSA
jgi:competence protein ComEC